MLFPRLRRSLPIRPPSFYRRRRTFTSTTPLAATHGHEPTYYDILEVPITASQAEIKKRFYALSLRHHPDRNRDDPSASQRFARISAAYNVLGNHTKRASYDRDHGILAHHMHASSTHSTATPGQHPMGSYSSYGANVHNKGASYAGSRPASGLSKRRGPFRGPPPSFYAHGGFGNRKPPPGASSYAGGATGGGGGGAGGASRSADDDPTSFIDRNPVYHFNARGHYRTQSAEDARREERRSRAMGAALNDQYIGTRGAFVLRFVVVCGMLAGAVALTGFYRWPDERTSKPTKPKPVRTEEQ
ncbi:DnaJ domain-containing protein [Aspergillus ambiguus]|uniref:DnaJ domain protein n=1 Tax=Aspergillus ambiguus TaxID=176160 RepID=UPI003CCD78AC